MNEWKPWFAWYPVHVGSWVWLTHVWRQRRMDHFDDPYSKYALVKPEGE